MLVSANQTAISAFYTSLKWTKQYISYTNIALLLKLMLATYLQVATNAVYLECPRMYISNYSTKNISISIDYRAHGNTGRNEDHFVTNILCNHKCMLHFILSTWFDATCLFHAHTWVTRMYHSSCGWFTVYLHSYICS